MQGRQFPWWTIFTASVAVISMVSMPVHGRKDCVTAGLRAHGSRVPYDAVGTTNPAHPLSESLFDFRSFALRTPHGHGHSLDEADRMHAVLCEVADMDPAIDSDGILTGDVLVSNSDADPVRYDRLHDNFVRMMLGEDRGRADALRAESSIRDATTTLESGDVLTAEEANAAAQGGSQPPLVSSSVWASLEVRADPIPIPAFPPAFIGLGLNTEVIIARNYRYLAPRADFCIGLAFPNPSPVFKVFINVAARGRISADGDDSNAMSTPGMLLSFLNYATYSGAEKMKETVTAGLDGISTMINPVDTPTHPSKVLEKYTEGFEKEYVDLLEDEWTYITEASTANDGVTASSNNNNVPDDNTILQAIEWIEKMLENTPERKDDGTLVWKYTASAWYKFTSDLRYRLSADGTWTWSPDNEHWMPIAEMTVRGGRYNGRKPSSDNQKTIKAIELIYVTLGGRHMASPNGGEETTRDDDAIEGDLNDVSYSPACSDRGGVCMDESKGATCPSGWITGLCHGPVGNKCCVDIGDGNTARPRSIGISSYTSNSPKCTNRGGVCMDASKGATCSSGWFTGLCRGPAAIKCCVDNDNNAGVVDDMLVSESASERADTTAAFWGGAEDPCDCETDGGKIGAYDPNAWGDQCRKWGGTSYKWCYVNGRSRNSCSKYPLRSSRGRYWRMCGLGVWASATVDDAVDTARDAKRTAERHIDRAVDAVNEHIVDPAARAINEHIVQPLTETQQGMWRRAKNVVRDVSQNWRRLKQEIGQTVRETGAFRFVQRTWFKDNAPRKPMLMFQGLAARMEKEGFSADDNLVERTLFKADAVIFRDFTRVLSIREALFAFCKKNAGVKGVMEHMRKVLGNHEAFGENGQTFQEHTRQVFGGDERAEQDHADHVPEFLNAGYSMSSSARGDMGSRGFETETDPSKVGIRASDVDRELQSHDREGDTMGNEDALEMYALLSEEIVERYEHIKTMTTMVARRLERLGNPDWSRLNDRQKEEYRSYFFSLRRLAAGLHGLLKQINAGNGPIKRGLSSGVGWLREKARSSFDAIKAVMAAQLGRNDWGLSAKLYMIIQIGGSLKIPTPIKVEAKIMIGTNFGKSFIVKTKHLEDESKTYSSFYTGPAFDVEVKFQRPDQAPLFVGVVKSEVRKYQDESYCVKKFGRYPCTEAFAMVLFVFPTNFGLNQATSMKWIKGMFAAGLLSDVLTNELDGSIPGLDVNSIMGGAGGGEDIMSFSFAPSNTSQTEQDRGGLETASDLIKSAAPQGIFASSGPTSGGMQAAAPQDDVVTMASEERGSEIFNLVKNYGVHAVAMGTTFTGGGNLGILNYFWFYQVGEPDDPEPVLSGIDKFFSLPFQIGVPTWSAGVLEKCQSGLKKLLVSPAPLTIKFQLDFGMIIWPIGSGHAKRAVSSSRAKGVASSSLAVSSQIEAQDEMPCDQAFIASRLSMLRTAVRVALEREPGSKVHRDTEAALRDMEDYERECAMVSIPEEGLGRVRERND